MEEKNQLKAYDVLMEGGNDGEGLGMESSPSIVLNDCPNNHGFTDAGLNVPSVRPKCYDTCLNTAISNNSSINASSSWPPRGYGSVPVFPEHRREFSKESRSDNTTEPPINTAQTPAEDEFEKVNDEYRIFSNSDFAGGGFPEGSEWNKYGYFLSKVWEDNSLYNSSLDCESSTQPSLSSSDEAFGLRVPESKNEEGCRLSSSDWNCRVSCHGRRNSGCSPELEVRRSTSGRDSQSFPGMGKITTTVGPRPFVNMMENSESQGEACGRPTLLLRSKAPPNLSKEGVSKVLRTQKQIPQMADANLCPSVFPTFSDNPNSSRNWYSDGASNRRGEDPSATTNHNPTIKQGHQNRGGRVFGQGTSRNDLSYLHKQPRQNCFHENQIHALKTELEEAQKRITTLSQKMEESSSHLQTLIEERRQPTNSSPAFLSEYSPVAAPSPAPMTYPLFPHQGYRAPHHPLMYTPSGIDPTPSFGCGNHRALGRQASWQYQPGPPPPIGPSEGPGADPRALENLRDSIVALQMQNIELNLFLKKEELRRKEAEDEVRKEKEYVRKLQESIQDLSSSTLVMDPLTYKEVADKYIASKKKPVRRTHTCNPYLGSSDLVCDANRLQVNQNNNQSSSCPSSPLGSNQERKMHKPPSRLSPPLTTKDRPFNSSASIKRHTRKKGASADKLNREPSSIPEWNCESESPVNLHQYQELLHSLDGLQVSSSPS